MMFKRLLILVLSAFVSMANAADKAAPVEVVFETTLGSYTLTLNPEKAPKTVANFLVYVNEGFFDGTLYHRVIPGFVIQGGGFEKGMVKKKTHDAVENESGNGLMNDRGTISMARTNHPDSATSQFFINVADNPNLDAHGIRPGYSVFGKVTAGMDVVDKIVAVPTTSSGMYQDVPKQDVVVLSAKVKAVPASQDKKAE